MDYKELFHDIIVESQGSSYAERVEEQDIRITYYHEGMRHGIIQGVTLGFRTMAEAGHIPQEIYEQWHDFAYSKEMDDPVTFRKVIMETRSNAG